MPQGQTTPEKTLSNPFYGKGFCEPNQYNSALERLKGGNESCEIMKMMSEELSEIFINFSIQLKQWSKTSQKRICHSREFGTTKQAWLKIIRATEKMSEQPKKIGDDIQKTIIDDMITYRTQNYGKSMLQLKKCKEFEKEFKKEQKPILQLLEKIDQLKEEVADAQRKLDHAIAEEKAIRTDAGRDKDEKNKAKANLERREIERNKLNEKYDSSIKELETRLPSYEENMYKILERTDNFERERLKQFHSVFDSFQKILAPQKNEFTEEIYEEFQKAIKEQQIEEDIKYFNDHYGRNTKNRWPQLD